MQSARFGIDVIGVVDTEVMEAAVNRCAVLAEAEGQ